jgi:hypothetical protein
MDHSAFRGLGLGMAVGPFVLALSAGLAMGEEGWASRVWQDATGQTRYAFTKDGKAWSREIEQDPRVIRLRWAEVDPLAEGLQVPLVLAAPADAGVFIVQFDVPPTDVQRAMVEGAGAQIVAFLPESAWIVRTSSERGEVARAGLAGLAGVRWVGAYGPALKAEPALLRGYLPAAGLEDAGSRARFAQNWAKEYVAFAEELRAGGAASFWIQVFDPAQFDGRMAMSQPVGEGAAGGVAGGAADVAERSASPMKRGVAEYVRAIGGVVQDVTPDDTMMRAMLTQEQLVQLLGHDDVAFVDLWGPAQTDMDIERNLSGANALETATGFSGEGVRGEVMDSGVRQTHQAFSNPGPTPIVRTNGVSTSHGTSTFGIVFGDGAVNAAGRGLLPDAEAKYFYSYDSLSGFGGGASRLTVTGQSVNTNSVVIQSCSFGSPLTTAYTTISQAMDQIVFNTGLVICQSQSNTGNQNSRPEAWAKNVLSVGAFNHNNDTNRANDAQGGASIGPAADSRVKPDIAHHYDSVLTADSASDTAYTGTFGGTSAATPITCGYMGLIHQMWHSGLFPGHGQGASVFASRPRSTTAKALALHSAFRYNWTGSPSNPTIRRTVQGWGVIDVNRLQQLAPTLYVENEAKALIAGQSMSYNFDVAPGTTNLSTTMVYLDPPGTVSSTTHRINDVSLRVTGPTGTFWWGNNGLNTTNWNTSGGVSNTKDTVEHVFMQNPPAGRYRIDVFADVVSQDANTRTPGVTDVSYALVVSGASRTPLRILTLNAARAEGCGGGATLDIPTSAAYSTLRGWLASPQRFGGAGGIDRPTQVTATAEFTPALVENADVVVVPSLNVAGLSSCELTVLRQFVEQGGGVIALGEVASEQLAPRFGAGVGDVRPAGSLALAAGSPVTNGAYGQVAGALSVGTHRVFTSVGSGAALLNTAGGAAAARFVAGLGEAVLITDAEWLQNSGAGVCGTPSLPDANNELFFLNALARVAPREQRAYDLSCCDGIDFNNDGGSFDPTDIDAFLSVFSEGPCVPNTATCNDIDFNNDGGLFDPCDIASFLLVFSEGPCSPCGQ